jgi:hypothetical protein
MIAAVCLLRVLTVGTVEARAADDCDATFGPPEIGVATMLEDGTVEIRRFVKRMISRSSPSALPPGVKIEVRSGSIEPTTIVESVPVVESHISRIELTSVVARRIDGRAVSHQALKDLLTRPTPVILATHRGRIEPLFGQMFKPDSLILHLPAQTSPSTVAPDPRASEMAPLQPTPPAR